MQINAVSNQNFGKLYIENGIENSLYNEIMLADGNKEAFKEVILDILDVQKSTKNHVYVFNNGLVEADSEHFGGRGGVFGRNLLERFTTALRTARSDKHQNYLTNYKRNSSFTIDV